MGMQVDVLGEDVVREGDFAAYDVLVLGVRAYETRPDLIFILPWNIKEEVMEQMAGVKEWGAEFFVAIPEVGICG